jgi:hypothetical protein
MSVPEWLDSTAISSGSRFGKPMLADTVTENGGDPDEQSGERDGDGCGAGYSHARPSLSRSSRSYAR